MIVQTVQITCMTGNAESVQRALADVVDDAREHEPDTLDYMVLRCDEGEMVLFTTVECFSDEAAMKRHNEADAVARFFEVAETKLTAPPEVLVSLQVARK